MEYFSIKVWRAGFSRLQLAIARIVRVTQPAVFENSLVIIHYVGAEISQLGCNKGLDLVCS